MLPVHRLPPPPHMDALQHGESCGQCCPLVGLCSRGAAGCPGPSQTLWEHGMFAPQDRVFLNQPAARETLPDFIKQQLCGTSAAQPQRWERRQSPRRGARRCSPGPALARRSHMHQGTGRGRCHQHPLRAVQPLLGARQPPLLHSLPAESTEGHGEVPKYWCSGTAGEANARAPVPGVGGRSGGRPAAWHSATCSSLFISVTEQSSVQRHWDPPAPLCT